MGIGHTLKDARERAGLSAAEIANRTKIKVTRITALETEAFDELPSGFYLDALVRAYAHEVHVDPEPLVDTLRRERGEVVEVAVLNPHFDVPPHQPAFSTPVPPPTKFGRAAMAIVALLVFGAGSAYLSGVSLPTGTSVPVEPRAIASTRVEMTDPWLTSPVSIPVPTFAVADAALREPASFPVVRAVASPDGARMNAAPEAPAAATPEAQAIDAPVDAAPALAPPETPAQF